MTELVLETRTSLTPLEILDWFYSFGFAVFGVKMLHRPEPKSGGKYCYGVSMGDAAGDRVVRAVDGQRIGGFPAIVRRVGPPQPSYWSA